MPPTPPAAPAAPGSTAPAQTAPAQTAPKQILAGIALILGAGFTFTIMDASAKYLAGRMPVAEIAWGRYLFATLALPLMLHRFGGLSTIRSRRLGLQLLRSFFVLCSTVIYWVAVKFIPLADGTAISFVGPLMLTALSVPFLKEKVGPRRWAAVLIGFGAALIIIRPGLGMAQPAALLPLASSFAFACYAICTRLLARSDGWTTTLIWSSLLGLLLLSLWVPFDWATPDLGGWLMLALLGLLASIGHLLLILAYARAPASTLAPFSYVALIWSTAIGFVWFGNFPDHWTLLGGAIIAASGLYVIHRERLRRAEGTPAD
jgi:drug/metabolite transporter (DMT)-like permease